MKIVKLDEENYFTGIYSEIEDITQNPFKNENYALIDLPSPLDVNKNKCYKLVKLDDENSHWEFDVEKYNNIISNTCHGKIDIINDTIGNLGTAAYKNESYFATTTNLKSELGIGEDSGKFIYSWYNKSTNDTDIAYHTEPSNSATRLLSTDLLDNSHNILKNESFTCSANSGYKYAVYIYTVSGNTYTVLNLDKTKSWQTASNTYRMSQDVRIIVMVGKSDNSNISISEASNVSITRTTIRDEINAVSTKIDNSPKINIIDGIINLPNNFTLPFNIYRINHKYKIDAVPESLNTNPITVYIKQTENNGLGLTEESPISLYQFKQNIVNNLYSGQDFKLVLVDKVNLFSAKNTFDLIGTSNTNVRNLTITSKDDMSWFGVGCKKTWVLTDGIYSTSESSKISDIVDLQSTNYFGMPKIYKKKSTLAEVKSEKGTFCQISGTLYLNLHSNNNIENIVCLYGLDYAPDTDCGVISIRKITSGNVIFQNIGFLMDSLMLQDTRLLDCSYWFFNCKWHRGSQDAFGINGVYRVYMIDCVADYASKDNFNYHATTKDSVVCEINCVSYGAGQYKLDTVGANVDRSSNNGSTAHNGLTVMRFGSKHWDCEGAIIADVHNCQTLNVECSSKNVLNSTSIQQFNACYMLHDNRNSTSNGINKCYRTDSHQNYLIGCSGLNAIYKYDVEGMMLTVSNFITNVNKEFTAGATITEKNMML